MNASATTPAATIPPPPQTENPIPAKGKGKETAVVIVDPPATRSKRARGSAFPGTIDQLSSSIAQEIQSDL